MPDHETRQLSLIFFLFLLHLECLLLQADSLLPISTIFFVLLYSRSKNSASWPQMHSVALGTGDFLHVKISLFAHTYRISHCVGFVFLLCLPLVVSFPNTHNHELAPPHLLKNTSIWDFLSVFYFCL